MMVNWYAYLKPKLCGLRGPSHLRDGTDGLRRFDLSVRRCGESSITSTGSMNGGSTELMIEVTHQKLFSVVRLLMPRDKPTCTRIWLHLLQRLGTHFSFTKVYMLTGYLPTYPLFTFHTSHDALTTNTDTYI